MYRDGLAGGGEPFYVTRIFELCAIYVDCWLTPEADPLELRRELRELLALNGLLERPLREAHKAVKGCELELAAAVFSSMW